MTNAGIGSCASLLGLLLSLSRSDLVRLRRPNGLDLGFFSTADPAESWRLATCDSESSDRDDLRCRDLELLRGSSGCAAESGYMN